MRLYGVFLSLIGPPHFEAVLRFSKGLFRLLGVQHLVKDSRQSSARHRSHDEHPHLRERVGGAVIDRSGDRRRNAASGVYAGARQIDADEVHEGKGQTDHDARDLAGACLLVRNVQDRVDEDAGQHDLGDQRADHAACGQFTREADGIVASVAGERHVSHLKDAEDQHRADKTAEDLADNVHAKFFRVHSLCDEAAERNGGVDVATRHSADGIRHCNNGETESKRCGNQAALRCRGNAASDKDEGKGADEFGECFL